MKTARWMLSASTAAASKHRMPRPVVCPFAVKGVTAARIMLPLAPADLVVKSSGAVAAPEPVVVVAAAIRAAAKPATTMRLS